jgi:MFS family permease
LSTEAAYTKLGATSQAGHRWWLFTACVLVSLTNEVSSAVTNLSLGPMRRDLGASSAVMQMAVTLGKLMLGAFMLAGGVAGDIYGRRRVLVLGALGMVGASLLAAAHRRAECSWRRALLTDWPAPPSGRWRSR